MNMLRSRSLPGVDFARPAEVLSALNGTFQMDDHGGMYFTIWYGVYEHGSRRLDYASAGHPPGLLLPADRTDVEKLQVKNMPIGITEDVPYREDAVEDVPPGTGLYLYSDGTYEVLTEGGEDLGAEGFAEIVAAPREEGVPDPVRIEREIRRRTGVELFDDDFSVLHVEFA
jgi:sigma-B regulation protein RsbU (phosphoserine phosphatase)